MAEGPESAAKGLSIFSALESATEVSFFLLTMTFALLVDSTLVHFHHSGLLDLVRHPELIHFALGLELILIFVGFSFLTSVIFPIVAIPVDALVMEIVLRCSHLLSYRTDDGIGKKMHQFRRRHNCVTPYELYTEAHELKDSYLLGLSEKYEVKEARQRKLMFKNAFYGFYALTMVIVNFTWAGTPEHPSMLEEVTLYFGSPIPIWIATAGLLVITYSRFWKSSEKEWVFCPTLYRTLEDRDKKRWQAYQE